MNIPSEYARMDNNLAKAQLSIGESSNMAQLALTYTYNYNDKKFDDYVCILSVLAQVSIDSAKRVFDIDLDDEIKLIKKDMDIKKNGYPKFWGIIKKDFNKSRINKELICPMNYLFDLQFQKFRSSESTLPMSYFFVHYDKTDSSFNRRKCSKVEELIEKYMFDLYESSTQENDDYLLLREDFEEMISDIKSVYISKTYLSLFSWLINRAFSITIGQKINQHSIQTILEKNKSILIKTLYQVNPDCLLKVFSGNLYQKV